MPMAICKHSIRSIRLLIQKKELREKNNAGMKWLSPSEWRIKKMEVTYWWYAKTPKNLHWWRSPPLSYIIDVSLLLVKLPGCVGCYNNRLISLVSYERKPGLRIMYILQNVFLSLELYVSLNLSSNYLFPLKKQTSAESFDIAIAHWH